MNKNLPKRKNIRLKNYDYSEYGAYFITICTEKRRKILSKIADIDFEIVGEGSPLPQLTIYGEIVDKWINSISEKYSSVAVDYYMIMPNHIHLLLSIVKKDGREDPSPTVASIIGWFKYNVTKDINQSRKVTGEKFFQRSYYDHIVRNQKDYEEISKYIHENPLKWEFDELYCEE